MRRILLIVLVLPALALGALVLWLQLRDPLAALPPGDPAAEVVAERVEQRPGRRLVFVTLRSERLGEIGIVASLPEKLPAQKLPVVLVLGGLGTGEHNIRYITEAGDNAIIGYDWPIPTRMPNGVDLLPRLPALYRSILAIPGQAATALGWAQRQGWADPARTSLLGVSLGALAAPAIERIAARDGIAVGWTILAYGGAPISALIAANPFVRPAWVRPVLEGAADLLLRPVEPALHLPYLSGHFLVLEGTEDRFVPPDAAALLRNATPQPRTVIDFPGGHIGPGRDQQALLAEVIAASTRWLVGETAVNPP
jgi:hypothetical protein